LRFSSQEDKVPGKDIREKLSRLEEYGYEGIELWGRPTLGVQLHELKQAFSTSRVSPSAICSGYSGDLLAAEREKREEAVRGVVERLKWANDLGAVGVIVVPTFGPPKVSDLSPLFEDQRELEEKILLRELKEMARTAEDLGPKVLLEPLNRYETHFMNRLEQAVSVCDQLGSEGVKVMADYFHMSIEESHIEESLERYSAYIHHVHLADSNRLLPGYGHTDFSSLRVLKAAGYKHYLSLECGVPGNPDVELPKALNYLKSYLK